MQQRPRDEGRHRSPFAAAFLSFLFPGLGQAYVGAYGRGLAFATPFVLVLALGGGLIINAQTRVGLLAALSSPTTLLAILVLDVLVLAYRVVVIVDAFRLASAANAMAGSDPRRGVGGPRVRWHPVAAAGLLAVILVASIAHVAVARYDLIAFDLLTSIGSGGDEDPEATGSLASGSPGSSGGAEPTGTPDASGAVPTPTVEPVTWDGKERLNILLLGVDKRKGDASFNTDTMIVLSIDPATNQAAMLSLPRDTTNVPLPKQWRANGFYGGVYPAKINSLWARARGQANLFPGERKDRGYNALKGALGELYQLKIPYYVQVDFQGFKEVIDTLGGVAIDVQMPVADDHYPSAGGSTNLYIPSGYQHMDGAEALAYARARHRTSDFDRAQRQQRVLTSLREQVDPFSLLEPGRLDALVSTLKGSVRTDIPPDLFPALVSLAGRLDADQIRSLVFTPPVYQTECRSCYSLSPKVAAIRRAVRNVFKVDKRLERTRVKVGEEGAVVWVLNGSGQDGQAGGVVDYLEYLGMNAVIPTAGGGRAERTDYERPVITVYNGAEATTPATIAALEQALEVKALLRTDPLVSADVIVITGAETPRLVVPD